MSTTIARHMPYPHIAGYVYDCPGCLSKCFCKPAEGTCAHCAAKASQPAARPVVVMDEPDEDAYLAAREAAADDAWSARAAWEAETRTA